MSDFAAYRMFDGHRFGLTSKRVTKRYADIIASGMRRNGRLARIVRVSHGYLVYTRAK